jgi:5,5'-dehydrodivanillate O-demethylase
MLTRAENEALTKIGPGTPGGDLLRRYWHVVAAASELTEAHPVKAVKILDEELAVFRMPPVAGETEERYGLVSDRCPHRQTLLVHGLVDPTGIRCIYHGWKFSPGGACLEQPAEGPNSTFKDKVRIAGYSVQKLAGLLFAYLGPAPAPLLPRWDVLVREDGRRWGVIESLIDCNWFQAMENSVDPAHLYWLHGSLGTGRSPRGGERYASLGLPEEFEEEHDFIRFRYGIQKKRVVPGKTPGSPPLAEEHPLVFPASLRLVVAVGNIAKQGYAAAENITPEEAKLGYVHSMQFRTPVDDAHTMHYNVFFLPSDVVRTPADSDPPYEVCPFKNPDGSYNLDFVTAQDTLAWEAQGAITDRSKEHLGTSDRGLIVLRKLLEEQIEIVRSGGDPIGVIRDPQENDTIDLGVYHEPFGLYRKETLV